MTSPERKDSWTPAPGFAAAGHISGIMAGDREINSRVHGNPLETDQMLAEVRAGLGRSQKELPPKFFYDRRGSELFEVITRLPEYYLTRAERSLLEGWADFLVDESDACTLLELGAGSAEKSRILLDAMRGRGATRTYVPVDVSASFLRETARRLRSEYPDLLVRPLVADITEALQLPDSIPRPLLIAFLGSTIGNFTEPEAVRMLSRLRAAMRAGDSFLLGVDLRKDPAVIEAAYDDAAGVTAEFNRNVLHVLNHELGADFEPDRFAHRAFYERALHRVEMHLVSRHDQEVRIPGAGVVRFREGESIRTEISCKYDRPAVSRLFNSARLRLTRWISDASQQYALTMGTPS